MAVVARLELRWEGEFWNAYFVPMNPPHEMIFFGSILAEAVRNDPARADAFRRLMLTLGSDIIEARYGVRGEITEASAANFPQGKA